MELLEKLVVLRCSGTVTEIGSVKGQWKLGKLVLLVCSGTVTEIGSAKGQWNY
jgi:hypothetical protein